MKLVRSNSSMKFLPVQKGFLETACPTDRLNRSWLSPCHHLHLSKVLIEVWYNLVFLNNNWFWNFTFFWIHFYFQKTATAVAKCQEGRGMIKVGGRPINLIEPEGLRYKVSVWGFISKTNKIQLLAHSRATLACLWQLSNISWEFCVYLNLYFSK